MIYNLSQFDMPSLLWGSSLVNTNNHMHHNFLILSCSLKCDKTMDIKQLEWSKIMEWFTYLIFLGLSTYFMREAIDKYFSGKSSFFQYDQQMTDLPIVTFCFDKANNNENSTKSEYIYKTDFTLDYLIGNNGVYESISLKEGQQVKIINESVTIEKVITRYSGHCYKG